MDTFQSLCVRGIWWQVLLIYQAGFFPEGSLTHSFAEKTHIKTSTPLLAELQELTEEKKHTEVMYFFIATDYSEKWYF